MPTPSSNQPPELPSPHGFSTCPDDLQISPRTGWPVVTETDGGMNRPPDTSSGERVDTAAVLAIDDNMRRTAARSGVEDSVMVEDRTTVSSSSRATTMSPRPRSSVTSGASLESTALDADLNKSAPASLSTRNLQNISAAPSRPENESPAGRRSPEQARSASSRADVDEMSMDDDLFAPSMGFDFPSMRTKPLSLSSYLRPGSRFHGTQQSERQVYDVSVEIKHVDMRESFLCGYLRIQGLTEDHPTLTTYFEGEIIGSQYNFFTSHDDWGANPKVDLSHWSKFSAFRPFQKQARRGPVAIDNVSQREHVFMRWKEHFLVPDHRVRTITGASFEGFYYICFNQVKGEVSGIYFHSKSEKFQQLELKHVPDRGCLSAMEFR